MGESILEKVKTAWKERRQIKVMPKVCTYQHHATGEVLQIRGDNLFRIWSEHYRSIMEYRIDDIADIRFLDEADPLAGMESIEYAPEDEEECPFDLAKEKWEWESFVSRDRLCLCSPGRVLAELADASKASMDIMAAAPEMLNKLEEVARGASVIDVVSEYLTVIPPGLLVGVNELIKKARGGG